MKGLEVELMQALQKQLGVPFETTVVANGPAIFTGVDTGRYDISFGQHSQQQNAKNAMTLSPGS